MPPRRIAVLLHAADERFESGTYLLRLLVEQWKSRGIEVAILRGVERFVPADLIIPHLDLTVTPGEYHRFVDRYPLAVNRRVLDISKSKFSANLVTKGDDYAGPVIVKTDRNFGGLPEQRLKNLKNQAKRSLPRRILRKARALFQPQRAGGSDWKWMESMKTTAYPVFPTLGEVPAGVFGNRNLVVEKFLPEMDGSDYCLRYSYFFGDREMSLLLRSKERVIKGSNAHRCEQTATPPQLQAIRRRMGFDYGKFDYVLRDGQVVLFDINRTPAHTALDLHQFTSLVASHLADGIADADGAGLD